MTAELSVVPSTGQATDLSAIERVIVAGDLGKLSAEDRWNYYRGVCTSVGLNPFTTPFAYITLNGKLTLYALKGATDQLRRLYSVSIGKPDVTISDGLCMVSVIATDRTGRTDAELGIVPIEGLRGNDKANAILKAITKAKRRVTLSMCGLGMLDETEAETIPSATLLSVEQMHGEAQPSPGEEERARAMVQGDKAADPKRLYQCSECIISFAEDEECMLIKVNGKTEQAPGEELARVSQERFGAVYCGACYSKRRWAAKPAAESEPAF